ncbi:MAG: hypothetical protein AB7I48_03015 [Planctomycetaceae bacterium]
MNASEAAGRLRALADTLDGYLVSTLLEIPPGAKWDAVAKPEQWAVAETVRDDHCEYRVIVEERGSDGRRLWRRWQSIVTECGEHLSLFDGSPLASAVVLAHRAVAAERSPLLASPPNVVRQFVLTGIGPAGYVLHTDRCGDAPPEIAAKSVVANLADATAAALDKLVEPPTEEPPQRDDDKRHVLLTEADEAVLAVANSADMSIDQKMRRIAVITPDAVHWESRRWGELFDVTPGRIRQQTIWIEWRAREKKSD